MKLLTAIIDTTVGWGVSLLLMFVVAGVVALFLMFALSYPVHTVLIILAAVFFVECCLRWNEDDW